MISLASHTTARGLGLDEQMHPVQIAALRKMSCGERLAKGMAFLRSARALLEAGVRTRHPGWTAVQVRAETQRMIANGGA